jgi:type IV secretion system protein TrbL
MHTKRIPAAAIFLTLLFFPVVALAGTGTGILDTVGSTLHSTIFGWSGKIQTATAELFAALAGVEVAIMFMNHVLQKRGHEDLFTGIIKKTITLGFFLWLINNAVGGIGFMPAIINGLANGASAVGAPPATPSTIATEALDVAVGIVLSPMADYTNTGVNNSASIAQFQSDIASSNLSGAATIAYDNFTTSIGNGASTILGVNFKAIAIVLMETGMMLFVALIAGGGIFMLALDFLMVQLESYLVMVLGMVVLAGGGLRYTSKYVGSYMDYGIGVGVRLFVISAISYLVVTVLFKDLMTTMAINNIFEAAFETAMLAMIIAILPKKATSIAQTLLTGQSSFGGEGGKHLAAGAGVAAVAATGGVALAAGGAVMGASALAKAAAAGASGSMSAASGGSAAGGGAWGSAGSLGGAASSSGDGAAAGVPYPGTLQPGSNGPSQSPGGQQGPGGQQSPRTAASGGAPQPSGGVPLPKEAAQKLQSQASSQGQADKPAESSAPAADDAALAASGLPGGGAAAEAAEAAEAAASGADGSNVEAPATTPASAGSTQSPAQGTAKTAGSAAATGKTSPGGQQSPAGGNSPAPSKPAAPAASTSASTTQGSSSGAAGGSSTPVESGESGGSAPASDGGNASPATESPAAPAEAPAPLPPVSDAHGVPAPDMQSIQKSLEQIARNTQGKKSGNVITRTEDSIKKYQDRANAIIEEAKPVKGQGISTEHMRDFD